MRRRVELSAVPGAHGPRTGRSAVGAVVDSGRTDGCVGACRRGGAGQRRCPGRGCPRRQPEREDAAPGCSSGRRCRRRWCAVCGPIRRGDEYRKFRDNLIAYGGRVVLDRGHGSRGRMVGCRGIPTCVHERGPASALAARTGAGCVRESAAMWNETASERYALLWKAATMAANRAVAQDGIRGSTCGARCCRLVGAAAWRVAHPRGPAGGNCRSSWPGAGRWSRTSSRRGSAYGFGYVDRNPLRQAGRWSASDGRGHEHAARYLARNAATYLSENAAATNGVALPGRRLRSYVSRRMTSSDRCDDPQSPPRSLPVAVPDVRAAAAGMA